MLQIQPIPSTFKIPCTYLVDGRECGQPAVELLVAWADEENVTQTLGSFCDEHKDEDMKVVPK